MMMMMMMIKNDNDNKMCDDYDVAEFPKFDVLLSNLLTKS